MIGKAAQSECQFVGISTRESNRESGVMRKRCRSRISPDSSAWHPLFSVMGDR
jgi:hypothetical protein